MIRKYSELVLLPTFKERFNYLKLDGQIGSVTFGHERCLNQAFYKSDEWKKIRDYVIMRDNACDLGVDGYEIYSKVVIHHLNPITKQDVLKHSDFLIDPEFLITTRIATHNALHYGDERFLTTEPVIRKPFDTCPWKKEKT